MLSDRRKTAAPKPSPQPPPQAAAKSGGRWVLLLLAVAGVALGGWYVVRERERKAERSAMLQAARDHKPDAAAPLLAHLAQHPDDAEALETLIEWQLWAKVPFAEVEPHLDRYCELRPDKPDSFRVRARLRVQNGRPEEGLADARRVLEAEPDDHNTRNLAAIAATEAGKHDVAVRELTRLLESSPVPRQPLAKLLVRNYLETGDAATAEQVLDRYFPENDPEGVVLRGRVHQTAGRHEAAIALFRTAADKFPKQREAALYHLSESQRALGRNDDAARTLEELDQFKARDQVVRDARQQPDDLRAQVRAAEQLLADGNPAEAAELLEQAVARLGKTPAAALLLARAYRQAGRNDLAARWERLAGAP
jgi:tetratricopeptide (TPR) repeat protein